jgi:hypothetical protein
MSSPFDFQNTDPWEASTGTMLPVGNHVCEIREIDGTGTSSGGYPQIELKVANADGEIRDWIVITPATVGKVVQLTDAVGIPRPDPATDFDPETGRLSSSYLDQAWSKQVGVVVRDEDDVKNPGQKRRRVQGYVPKDKIAESDATPAGAGREFSPPPGAPNQQAQDKIPF